MVFRPGQHPTGLLSHQRSGTFTKTRCSGFGFRGAWRNLAVKNHYRSTVRVSYGYFWMFSLECFPLESEDAFSRDLRRSYCCFCMMNGNQWATKWALEIKQRPISFVNNKGQIIKAKARCLPWICEVNSLLYPFIWKYHPVSSTSQRRITPLPDGKDSSHLWFRSWLIQDTLQKQFSSDL